MFLYFGWFRLLSYYFAYDQFLSTVLESKCQIFEKGGKGSVMNRLNTLSQAGHIGHRLFQLDSNSSVKMSMMTHSGKYIPGLIW